MTPLEAMIILQRMGADLHDSHETEALFLAARALYAQHVALECVKSGTWVTVPRDPLQALQARLVDMQEEIDALTDGSPDPDLVAAIEGRPLRKPKHVRPGGERYDDRE